MKDHFSFKARSCAYSPLAAYDQTTIDQLHMIQLSDNSVLAASVVNNSVSITRILPTRVSYTYEMRACDLKVCLINTINNGRDALKALYTDNQITFLKMCEGVEISYNDRYSTIVPIDYLKWLASQYKDPAAEATKNKGFKLVGTFEQGGYLCPKCKGVNNAYTFSGTCDYCGY